MAERIAQALFDVLAIGTRRAGVRLLAEELSWWATADEDAIGAVFLDRTDGDFCYVILARDAVGRFAAHEVQCGFASERIASVRLRLAMEDLVRSPDFNGVIVQGGEPRSPLNLFIDRNVPDALLHPSFLVLRDDPSRAPSRFVFAAISPWLVTSDRHLVAEFQGSQFDQRLWEIYLWAMFRDQGMDVEHREAPDLIVSEPGLSFAVEATTVASSRSGALSDLPAINTPADIAAFLLDYMPIKFGSALTSKLKKRNAAGEHYWEMRGCESIPFVLAIADFHRAPDPEHGQPFGSMTYSQSALSTYLYGSRRILEQVDGKKARSESIERHVYRGKEIPSGFFRLPAAENVSAVIFSNAATLAKFDRMGVLAGQGDPLSVYIRAGVLFDPDPDAFRGIPFRADVRDPSYQERWGDDVQVFHNPRALRPLPDSALPEAVHFREIDGTLMCDDRGGRVLSSSTFIGRPRAF